MSHSRISTRQEIVLDRVADQFSDTDEIELLEHARLMAADGLFTERELVGDFCPTLSGD